MDYTTKKKKKNDTSNAINDSDGVVDISNNINTGNENDFTYEKYLEMKKNGQILFDSNIVNDYFTNAKSLFDDVAAEQNNNSYTNYNWAINANKQYADRINNLAADEEYVSAYLESIKGSDDYDKYSKQFTQYKTALSQTKDYLDGIGGFASQYDNEDDYNSAMTEINRQQKYKDYSYDDLIKASNESEDEDEAEWLKSYANDKVSLKEIKGKRDKVIARQNEVNAQINEYMDKERAAFSTEEKQKYAALLDPLYKESDELKKQLIDYNPVFEQKQTQANAAEWETKYKGLNYGELLSEIRDEKSTAEKKWLQDKADEVATSEDYQSQLNELKARQEAEHSNWGGSNEYSGDITELENKLKLKQRAEKAAEYETLVNSPDFADNNSMEWNHIGANDMLTYMNDEEKQVYSYLHNTGREDEAEEYSKLIQPRLTERYTQTVNEWAQQYATEHPWLASGLSLGSNLISGAGIVEDIGKRIVGEPIDVNSPMHYGANMTNALRSTVSDKYLGDVGTFGYDTVMSAADSAINMAVSTAIGGAVGAVGSMSTAAVESLTATVSSTIMSSQVATNTVIDAKERGLSDDQAVTLGVLYGVVEGLSEKWSIERFIHDPTSIGSALRKAAIAEGTEEIAANWGDRIVDALVTGDKNKVSEQYQNYIKQGFSDKEALTMTLYNMVGEDTSAFLAGGLSGVAMSGTHMALAGVSNEVQQAKARTELENLNAEELVKPENRETLNEIIKSGKYLDKNSKGYKLADRLENAVNADEQISAKDVKQLRREIVTQGRKIAKEDSKRLGSVTKDFTDEEKSTTSILGEKLRSGESLSNQEVKFLKNNKKILKAVSQYSEIDEDSVIELADSERFKNNFRYYKSNGNGLIEHDGSEFRGTVEIKSIDSKTGEATYNLIAPDNTVTTAKASEISFKDKNEADLHRAAANFRNVNEANAFIENYDGGDIKNYVNEWNLFSNYGRLGFNQSQISNRTDGKGINTASKEAAYKYGMDAFKSFAQAQYLKSTALEISAADFSYQKGTYTNSVSEAKKKNLTAQQKGAIRFLRTLSYFGVNVEVFESKTNDKGNYVGENGSYDRATKTLRVDVNAGLDNVKQTVTEAARHGMFLNIGHELTHTAEQGKGYLKLRSEIVRTLDKAGFDYSELVDKKVNELSKLSKYKDLGTEELYRLADSEAIADCCETMLQNTKLFDNLLNVNRSFAERLVNAIKKIAANLRSFFKENPLEAKTEYGQALLEAMNKVENRVQELWDKAVSEGIRAEKAENRNNTTLFSIRIDIDGNKYVDVDHSIYDNTDGQSIAAVIAKIISTRFHNLISVNGQKIQINKTTNDEWRMSKSARFLQKTDTQAYNDKLRSIANADEILKVANNWVGEKLTHKRTDNIIEFARGNLLYKVGDNGYIADVIVGTKDNGATVLYDIKNIYSKKITEAPRVTKGESESNSLRTPSASVNDTIPQSTSKINTSDESSSDRFNDSDYLSAVERGDMKTAQQMVDEAAKAAGYNSPKLYHGTRSFGFTKFDLNKMDDGISIFLTSTEETASTYSGNNGIRRIGKKSEVIDRLNGKELAKMYQETRKNDLGGDYLMRYFSQEEARKMITASGRASTLYTNYINMLPDLSEGAIITYRSEDPNTPIHIVELKDARSYLHYVLDDISGNYALYAKLQNPLVIDAKGALWNDIKNWRGQIISTDNTHVIAKDGKYWLIDNNTGDYFSEGIIIKNSVSDSWDKKYLHQYLVDQAVGILNQRDKSTKHTNTRRIAQFAKQNGYDGVIFKNLEDNGGKNVTVTNATSDVYVVFDSAQVKSADPVTYDDDGNVIPLSERFNEDKEDIRYQDRTDPDYFDELFDMGDDLFEDESKRQTLNELIDKYPDDALSIIKHAAEQTIENVLTKTKSIKLSDKAYLSIAQKFMQDYNISRAANPGEDAYLVSKLKNIVARVEAGELTTGEDVVNEIIEVARDALMLGGTLDDSMKEERDFVLGLLKGKTLIVTDYNESDIRENYGDLKRYRSKLGHGYIALERNAKKKLGGVQGVYINEIITEVQQAYPALVDDDASEATGFSWLERLMNDKLEPTFRADTTSTPEIDAVNAGFEIIENLLDRKARQIVNAKGGQKYVLLGNSARETAQEQRKAIREAVSKAKEKERQKSKEALKKQRDKFNEKIREVKTTERAKAKEAVDKQRQKTREVRQNKNKLIIAEKQLRMNEKRQIRNNYERRGYITRIKKYANDFKKIALGKSVPLPQEFSDGFYNVAMDITEAIKLSDNTAIGEKLSKTVELMRNLAEDRIFGDTYATELTETFRSQVAEFAEAIKNKKIDRNLTVEEAENICNILLAIKETVRNANRILAINEGQTVKELGLSIMAEQNGLNVGKLKKNFVNFGKYFMTSQRLGYLFNGYDDNAALVKLMDSINIGQRRKNMFYMTANKMFDDYRAEHVKELDNTEKNVRTIHWKDNAGTDRTTDMTGMQAMQIVMTWNREVADENLVHITKGGLTISNPELLAKGNYKKAIENSTRIIGINNSFITAVASSLTDFEKGYIDIAERFFNELATDAVNETSLKLHHIKIANSRYYIPIKVDQDSLVKEIEGVKHDSSIEAMGMLKAVTPKSSKPIYIYGLDNVINGHISDVSNYYGLAVPIRDLNKVLNVQDNQYDESGDLISSDSVKNALNKNWGKQAIGMYEQMLTDLQNSRAPKGEKYSEGLNNLIRTVRSNFVTSTLNANKSVMLKQAASYTTAGAYLSGGSLTAGLKDFALYNTTKGYKRLLEEIDSHTAQHYIRRKGLSSNEIADISQNWINRMLSNSKAGRALSTSELAQKIPKGVNPNNWIQEMDCLTTAALWCATKAEVNKEFNKAKKEIDTAEYWQAVTDLYDKVIEDTQPMYDPLHRPEVLKTSNELLKSIFMFKTQPLQNAGIIYDALGRVTTNAKDKAAWKKLGKAVASQSTSLIVFSLMSLAVAFIMHRMKRYRDKDNELTAQSVMDRVFEDMLISGSGVLLPFGGSEVFGAIFDGNEIVQDNVAQTVTNYIESGQKLVTTIGEYFESKNMELESDPSEILTALKSFATLTAQNLFGIPVNNVIKNINGYVDWIKDLTDGDGQLFAPEEQTKKQIAGSYVKRLESGNSAEAQQILTDMYNQELETAKADPNVKNPETKAQGAVRDMLVNAYKTEYQKAFLRNDDKEMRRIAQIFISAKKYMTWNNGKTSLDNKLEEWRKTAKETIQKKY